MPLSRSRRPFRPSPFVVALVLIAGLLLPAVPVHAIYGSDPIPAGKYPYVAGIWIRFNCCVMKDEAGEPIETYFAMPNPPGYPFFDEDGDGDVDPEFLEGPKVRANGVLIAPNVVLTQGAHFGNGRRVGVSFKEQLGDIDPGDDAEFDEGAAGVYAGSVYHMPGIDRESEGFIPNDLAVIVLDGNVAASDYGGILATLPALGALDTQKGTEFTAISYGPQTEAPYTPEDEDKPTTDEILAPFVDWDFTQRQSPWTVAAVDPLRLRLEAPSPSWYCDADEGAPFIDDRTGTVAALMTFWPEYCHVTIAYGYRLDTEDVRDFLCAVSQGQFDEVKDTNVTGLPAETDPAELDAVRYELTRESVTVLDEFC